jgi:hypothetical protein
LLYGRPVKDLGLKDFWDWFIDKIVYAAVFTVNRLDLETQRSKDIVDINMVLSAIDG